MKNGQTVYTSVSYFNKEKNYRNLKKQLCEVSS